MYGKRIADIMIIIYQSSSGLVIHLPERSSRYQVNLSMHSQGCMKSMEKRCPLYVNVGMNEGLQFNLKVCSTNQ